MSLKGAAGLYRLNISVDKLILVNQCNPKKRQVCLQAIFWDLPVINIYQTHRSNEDDNPAEHNVFKNFQVGSTGYFHSETVQLIRHIQRHPILFKIVAIVEESDSLQVIGNCAVKVTEKFSECISRAATIAKNYGVLGTVKGAYNIWDKKNILVGTLSLQLRLICYDVSRLTTGTQKALPDKQSNFETCKCLQSQNDMPAGYVVIPNDLDETISKVFLQSCQILNKDNLAELFRKRAAMVPKGAAAAFSVDISSLQSDRTTSETSVIAFDDDVCLGRKTPFVQPGRKLHCGQVGDGVTCFTIERPPAKRKEFLSGADEVKLPIQDYTSDPGVPFVNTQSPSVEKTSFKISHLTIEPEFQNCEPVNINGESQDNSNAENNKNCETSHLTSNVPSVENIDNAPPSDCRFNKDSENDSPSVSPGLEWVSTRLSLHHQDSRTSEGSENVSFNFQNNYAKMTASNVSIQLSQVVSDQCQSMEGNFSLNLDVEDTTSCSRSQLSSVFGSEAKLQYSQNCHVEPKPFENNDTAQQDILTNNHEELATTHQGFSHQESMLPTVENSAQSQYREAEHENQKRLFEQAPTQYANVLQHSPEISYTGYYYNDSDETRQLKQESIAPIRHVNQERFSDTKSIEGYDVGPYSADRTSPCQNESVNSLQCQQEFTEYGTDNNNNNAAMPELEKGYCVPEEGNIRSGFPCQEKVIEGSGSDPQHVSFSLAPLLKVSENRAEGRLCHVDAEERSPVQCRYCDAIREIHPGNEESPGIKLLDNRDDVSMFDKMQSFIRMHEKISEDPEEWSEVVDPPQVLPAGCCLSHNHCETDSSASRESVPQTNCIQSKQEGISTDFTEKAGADSRTHCYGLSVDIANVPISSQDNFGPCGWIIDSESITSLSKITLNPTVKSSLNSESGEWVSGQISIEVEPKGKQVSAECARSPAVFCKATRMKEGASFDPMVSNNDAGFLLQACTRSNNLYSACFSRIEETQSEDCSFYSWHCHRHDYEESDCPRASWRVFSKTSGQPNSCVCANRRRHCLNCRSY